MKKKILGKTFTGEIINETGNGVRTSRFSLKGTGKSEVGKKFIKDKNTRNEHLKRKSRE